MSNKPCVKRLATPLAWGIAAVLVGGPLQRAMAQVPGRETFVYKTVGALQIKADVYRPRTNGRQPVAVWIHGGALITGTREAINERFLGIKTELLSAGCTVVSISYRLAPETRLEYIVSDVEDALAWIRREGTRLFAADPARVAVMGGSAGGYLALTTGHRVHPPPQAIVALFAYGDLIGDWYSKPSFAARHRRIMMDHDEAYRQVSGPPVADARDRAGGGNGFYQYLRRTGGWPKAVSGWDPHVEADRFVPFMPVNNVFAGYPPTLLIHGTEDTDVPYQQSVMMADQLRAHGVRHRLVTVEGAEHGLSNVTPERLAQIYREAASFVIETLGCSREPR